MARLQCDYKTAVTCNYRAEETAVHLQRLQCDHRDCSATTETAVRPQRLQCDHRDCSATTETAVRPQRLQCDYRDTASTERLCDYRDIVKWQRDDRGKVLSLQLRPCLMYAKKSYGASKRNCTISQAPRPMRLRCPSDLITQEQTS